MATTESSAPPWREVYLGGSAETERETFERLARTLMQVQLTTTRAAARSGVPQAVDRAFHAKATLAVDGAELRFVDAPDLPEDLRAGFARPGAAYPTTVRFSNAAGSSRRDDAPDLRGVALRVRVSEEESHDLLATNYPVSHARDAVQFVEFARATAGGRLARLLGLLRLLRLFGPRETVRMLRNVLTGRRRPVGSVVVETYWSRGAVRWGPTSAVRYLLRPAAGTPAAPPAPADDPDHLRTEARDRLTAGPARLELCVQRYVDETSTPVEDTATAWSETVSPPVPVAVLTLPQVDLDDVDSLAAARRIDGTAFNPWNTTEEFRPLGNLNRARKSAYDASAAHRLGTRWEERTPLRNVLVGGAARGVFAVVNRRLEWHRLPVRLGLLNLEAFRHVLRQRNLLDSELRDAPPAVRPSPPAPPDEAARLARSVDGSGNDLSEPAMGAVGAAFGRNLPPVYREDLLDEPNPVVVARELLHREHFLPARTLNVLAAAWIQFQVHDWVDHARHPLGVADDVVPMPPGTTWASTVGGPAEDRMRIAGNVAWPDARPHPRAPVFANRTSHWWDGSEVYGADAARSAALREGAKLRLTSEGYLPEDTRGQEMTGFNDSWWLGLSGLHTLFAREHNLLCDELRAHYRGWDDERVYQTARLIVSAMIAKIHTVEWTPAVLGSTVIDIGLKANWNGPPAGDWLTRLGIWLLDEHSGVGIPRTRPDHHGAPYSLTEDFATVYRMHPLLPDDYRFEHHASGDLLGRRSFLDIQGTEADEQLRALGLTDTLYSFGVAHPGAITLHNFPHALRRFERDGEVVDLAVVDLVRTRRRGVPRYNDFRAGLHRPRVRSFEEISPREETVRRLREVYRTVDDVDTVVGLLGEAPPPGFGFSDTAFRIFILMASRRLQSDRFLTVDFRPEVYSPLGMDWVDRCTMTDLVLRHCPELAGVLPRGANAFAPWRPVVPAGPLAGAGRS